MPRQALLWMTLLAFAPLSGCADGAEPSGPADGAGDPGTDPVGVLVFASGRDGNQEIYALRDDGSALERLTDHPGRDIHPSWSADRSRIVFQSDRSGSYDLWVMDVDGSGLTQLTAAQEEDWQPAWSPDGTMVAFGRRAAVADRVVQEIFLVNADGTGLRRVTRGHYDGQPAWSPDGERIAFVRVSGEASGFDIYELDVESGRVRALLAGTGDEAYPAWSPDGSRLAYVVIEGGLWRTHTAEADGSSPELLIDEPWSSLVPSWSPDGRELAFVRFGGGVQWEIFTVSAQGGEARQLTEGAVADGLGSMDWVRR